MVYSTVAVLCRNSCSCNGIPNSCSCSGIPTPPNPGTGTTYSPTPSTLYPNSYLEGTTATTECNPGYSFNDGSPPYATNVVYTCQRPALPAGTPATWTNNGAGCTSMWLACRIMCANVSATTCQQTGAYAPAWPTGTSSLYMTPSFPSPIVAGSVATIPVCNSLCSPMISSIYYTYVNMYTGDPETSSTCQPDGTWSTPAPFVPRQC